MLKNNFFKKHWSVVAFFVLLVIFFVLIFSFLCRTPIYQIENGHNDRLFSADDIYYVENFYSVDMDDSPRVIKHPLLIVFANVFTLVERFIFGELSIASHYKLIILLQMLVSIVSTLYLFLILDRQYHLDRKMTFLFCGIYSCAFSTLFYTFIAESYIFSSLILLMTYYYVHKKNIPVTIVLGALAAGVTITNAVLWAVIVIFSCLSKKEKLVTVISGGILFCLLVVILPIRSGFYEYILPGGLSSAENYSDSFGILKALIYTFFAFFGSTVFYLDTMNMSAFGEFNGDSLTFIPSASVMVVIMSLLWMILLFYSVLNCRKDRRLYSPLAVIAVNFILHGIIQYGLKEAFLYSLHHFSAQILIIALIFAIQNAKKTEKYIACFLLLFLFSSFLLNLPGYNEMFTFINK